MHATERINQLITSTGAVAVETLHAFYDGLPAIDTPFMLGAWEGGVFRTGHPGESQLVALGWVGKAFHGEDDVDPIVVLDAAGQRQASPVMGKATLRFVRYRGVCTATMVYDKHPIFDHFKQVDEETVLGVMDRKGEAFPLYFWLRRVEVAK